MKKVNILLVVLVLGCLCVLIEGQTSPTVEKIRERQFMVCGVSFDNILFGEKQGLRGAVGFDMDYCRALAAAVFGPNIQGRLVFLETDFVERFEVLRNGTADVVVRTTTFTIGRDTVENVTFSRPNFYDGQAFMVAGSSPIETLEQLDQPGNTYCVTEGSTGLTNAEDIFSFATPVVSDGDAEGFELFVAGQCTSMLSDVTSLHAFKRPDDRILPELISREPLCAVTDERDNHWSELVRWVVNSLVLAESYGVNKASLETIDLDDAPGELQRLLGNLDSPLSDDVGNDFALNALRVVGSYGDIYSRHIGAAITRFNTFNELWLQNSGLQYSNVWSGPSEAPFTITPEPNYIDTVRARGHLRCGSKHGSPLFSLVDPTNTTGGFAAGTGFDADFCAAVATAIFAGESGALPGDLPRTEVVDHVLVQSSDRFANMASGNIDILVRQTTATVGRDIVNGVTFTRPSFYDGQGVIVRVSSGITSLIGFDSPLNTFCVASGTTSLDNALSAFKLAQPVLFADEGGARDGYFAGQCTGFTTDTSGLADFLAQIPTAAQHRILPSTISREPLCLTASDRDPKFFEVVNWVRNGLVLAEAYGITQQSILNLANKVAENDPFLDQLPAEAQRLLGVGGYNETGLPLHPMFMRWVIASVGNYGEIYARHLESQIPRNGTLNALWLNGGILYPEPWNGLAAPSDTSLQNSSSFLLPSLSVSLLLFLLLSFLF